MAQIIKTHTYPDGQMIGWDAEVGDWVELDRAMMEGSFVGNVGRAAARGMAEIAQGVQEIADPGERTRLEGERLAAQRYAAQNAAPYAEALGNVVPDVTAGLAMAPLTGGMSLPAMLLAESAAGGLMGGIRPGSIDERMGRAALGALGAVGGAAIAPAAAAGVGGALRVFNRMEGATLGRLGREVEAANENIRIAGETVPAGRSVGAAETPEELLGRTGTEAEEAANIAATEEAGAVSSSPGFEKKLNRAIDELGHTATIGQGTRAFSAARLGQAGREFLPMGQQMEQRVRAANQRNLVQKAARAAGDEGWESVERMDPSWFASQEARLSEVFSSIEGRLPQIDVDDYAKSLGKIDQTQGLFGKMRGQKDIENAIEAAKARGGSALTSAEVMQTRKWLSARMAEYYSEGARGAADGEVIMDALNRLDKSIENEIKKNKYKTGLAEKWASARSQWSVLAKLEHGASVGGTGDINPVSLMKQLQKDRSKGGFGRGGPQEAGVVKDLFDLTEVMVDSQSHVPMTGMRSLIRAGSKITANQLGIGGALGGASIWGD